MLRALLGRALLRWLERLVEPERPIPAGPTPEITLTPPTEASARDSAPPETGGGAEIVYPRVQRQAMGSQFEVYLAGTERATLIGAAEEALNEVERLERQLSHYRDDSDIARLNRHAGEQWVRLEPRLYLLLKRCAELSAETEGAFDVTIGPLVKAWGFYRGEGRIPSDEEIAQIMQSVGMHRILFDDDDHLVYFTAPGLQINLGAIGKGYAIDAAVETLRFYHVRSAVLHGGQSTIYALGAPPDTEGWTFTLRDPRDHATPIQTLTLRDEALSTSGDYEQFFDVDGVRYSHVLDPRTGRPAQGVVSVSVIAPSAADSDALSTALFVLGRERAEAFCRTHPAIRAILVEERPEGRTEVHRLGAW